MTTSQKFTRGWFFVAPSLILVTLIVGVPLFYAARYSLHDVLLYRFDRQVFVGLENYYRLMEDPLFLRSLRVTLIFTVANTVLSTALGLVIAFVLSSRMIRYRSVFMAIFLVPFVMTQVVTGIAFKLFVWEADFGAVNHVLLALGLTAPGWLIDGNYALTAVTATNVWRLTPLALLVFYAALTTIPGEHVESAQIDGARPFAILWHVILPQVRHHLVFVTLIVLTSAFREFDTVFALTGGGPGRETLVLSILAYQRGLTNQDMGYANAIAFTMFIIIAVISWVFLTASRSRVSEAKV